MRTTTVFKILALLFASVIFVQGYGFRYRYNAPTQETQLWTHLPGTQPVVYENNFLVRHPVTAYQDPGLFKYYGPDGRQRWRCKIDAHYSEFFQKCLWKPGHYFVKAG